MRTTASYWILVFGFWALSSGEALSQDALRQMRAHALRESDGALLVGGPFTSVVSANLNSHVIYKRGTSGPEPLFETPERIREFWMAPGTSQIAVISERFDDQRRRKTKLQVVDTAGKEVVGVEGVWDVAWSPDGKSLAFTKGDYVPGSDDNPFISAGTWLLDLSGPAAKQRKILPGGLYLSWAKHDGAIYVYDIPDWYMAKQDQVFRFDPPTNKSTRTSHKGIHFSPSGKYYFMPSVGRGPGGVFGSDNDRELEDSSSVLRALYRWAEGIYWLPIDQDMLLLYSRYPIQETSKTELEQAAELLPEARAVVYDPGRDRARELGADAVVGRRGDSVVVLQGGVTREVPSASLLP